jgi:hypothetical protein
MLPFFIDNLKMWMLFKTELLYRGISYVGIIWVSLYVFEFIDIFNVSPVREIGAGYR